MKNINVNWNKMTESFGKRPPRGGTKDHILYRMKNKDSKVIRIGACTNLNDRMNLYKNDHRYRSIAGSKTYPKIWKETITVEYMVVKSRELLLDMEKKAIKRLRPIYNVIGI
jgi:excinuclease UvrABC nuclease subunit